MTDFNDLRFNYKGYGISVADHDNHTIQEVAIVWNENNIEVVAYFNDTVSLIRASNKAKELIDWKRDSEEMLRQQRTVEEFVDKSIHTPLHRIPPF